MKTSRSLDTPSAAKQQDCPIWIINLSSSTERRERISSRLEKLGLRFEFFNAVDGRKGLPRGLEHLVDRDLARRRLFHAISDAEVAVQISHANLYRKMVEEGVEEAVILEDDACVGSAFWGFVMDDVRKRFDMVLLAHEKARAFRGVVGRLRSDEYLYRLRGPCHLTAGYYLSNRGAKFLFSGALPVSYVADWPVDISDIGAVACSPAIIGHELPMKAASTISTERNYLKSTTRRGRSRRMLTKAYWRKKVTPKHLMGCRVLVCSRDVRAAR